MTLKIELPKATAVGTTLETLQCTDVFVYNDETYMWLEHDDDHYIKVLCLGDRLVSVLRKSARVRKLNATLTVLDPLSVPTLNAAEESILRYGQNGSSGKIPAIKLVRERLGYGLKEAKEFVEVEAKRLGINLG